MRRYLNRPVQLCQLAEKRIQNEHESSLVLRPFRQTRLFGHIARPGFVATVETGAKYGFQLTKALIDPVKSSLHCPSV